MSDDEIIEEASVEVESPAKVPIAGIGTLVFGKWDAAEVTCDDPGIAPYINLTTIGVPLSGGIHANQWFGKQRLSLIERFTNGLMRRGPNSGKKGATVSAMNKALDKIHDRTGENPLQILVNAVVNSAPCEGITRIRFGATSQPKAVDVSPSRRVDMAVRNLTQGATSATVKSKRNLTQCIVNEVLKAAEGDVSSFAVSKREETERIAASAR
ncbi:MAG: 30S ribosomal protein S7 [Methanobacteriota archaeon]|nr:MAG: 30S ribosomal protein S7 [Euryarchaeota archaeon TMED255]RAH09275.1 MAG: 30S ribosomal protein S7 [Euryarchaeota archaeon]CAI8225283.1 MAG: 30S ribosomal protein S7 [Euryarchaeota archaeon]|tara:strand:- start:1285 stop:1920 length:636 start_codon:yes stop_codon:yes gene_type:complete